MSSSRFHRHAESTNNGHGFMQLRGSEIVLYQVSVEAGLCRLLCLKIVFPVNNVNKLCRNAFLISLVCVFICLRQRLGINSLQNIMSSLFRIKF